jgi:hypothetical protein
MFVSMVEINYILIKIFFKRIYIKIIVFNYFKNLFLTSAQWNDPKTLRKLIWSNFFTKTFF